MKILIAIPCMDTLPVQFAESLLNLVKPAGTSVCFKQNSLIYDSRNLLSLTAMDDDYDRVLWLDSDMQFQPDLLLRLSMLLDDGADMATGVYFKRHFPIAPVIYSTVREPQDDGNGNLVHQIVPFLDYPERQIFPVAGCGFGACMTSVDLLRAVWHRFGPAFAPYPWAGEDISFCYRANLLHFKIVADSRISLGHIGQAIFTEEIYRKNRGDGNEKH